MTANSIRNLKVFTALALALAAPARAQVLVQESFDSMKETVLNGQNGWKSNSKSTIQTEHNAQGGGKALKIDAPDGSASKVLFPEGLTGIVALDFRLLLEQKTSNPSAKVLLFLHDTDKKRATLFFHSEANQWGLKSGPNYPHVSRKIDEGKWQSVRLVLNYDQKHLSVYVADGAKWITVFSKQKFDDETARNFSSVEFVRNGQGSADPVYVDELAVQKLESDKPPVAEASVLQGDTPAKPRFAVFHFGETVEVKLSANRKENAAQDILQWKLEDWNGATLKEGNIPVVGAKWETSLNFPALPPGYYALHGSLQKQGDKLPAKGSRPEGILSFGVLPNIAPYNAAAEAQSRFGIWGTNFIQANEWLKGDPYNPLTTTIGATWSGLPRQWFKLEPERAGQWQPKPDAQLGEFSHVLSNKLPYVVMLEGMPAWNLAWPAGSPAPQGDLGHVQAQAYPPKDWGVYADFLKRVAREQVALRKKFPYQQYSYYLIHHEPDWHWKGTDEEFVKMYQVAHRALHEVDPGARLIGPRYGVLKNGIANLERLFPLGLGKYMDGIAFHTYYLPPRLSNSPEAAGMPDMVRHLRELAQKYIGPKAFLAQLEWGVRYELSYEGINPALLRRHATQTARGHLISLGEGALFSYLFYTSDYTGEPGYGITFNLLMPDPNFGTMAVSPKPTYMAVCTMSRLLAGTQTIGRIENPEVLGYSFKRGSQYLTALWSKNGNPVPLKLKTQDKAIQVVDLMGKTRTVTASQSPVRADDAPVFLLSNTPVTLQK